MHDRLRSLSVFAAALAALAAGCSKGASAQADAGPRSGDVRVTADDKGFHPASVTFAKGAPASLTFVRTTDGTCATDVVFPELKVKKALALNTPTTIEVPTTEARTLAFQCGMGMFRSTVVVQ